MSYADAGYVVLKGVLDPSVIRSLDEELEAAIPRWAAECEVAPSDYLAAVCRWGSTNPVVAQMGEVLAPEVEAVVAEILGASVRRTGQSLFRKCPAAAAPTHAHQDATYSWDRADRRYAATAWVPLTDADSAAGALEVLPGSHRSAQERVDFIAADFRDRRDSPKWGADAMQLEVEPSDVVVFHSLLWHASTPLVRGRRAALAVRWRTDEPLNDLPGPEHHPDVFGMDTCGAHVDQALRHLLGDGDEGDTEALVERARTRGILASLPEAAAAETALLRYLLLRKAGALHAATAQRGMVWEALRDTLTSPVLGTPGALRPETSEYPPIGRY